MLQGIGYNPYNTYNLINYPKLTQQSVSEQQVKEESKAPVVGVDNVKGVSNVSPDYQVRRANAPLEDISLSLNKSSEFDFKGSASDINSLDIEKAVSDMQKDEALMQYRYFVGNDTPIFQSEDGVVIPKMSM